MRPVTWSTQAARLFNVPEWVLWRGILDGSDLRQIDIAHNLKVNKRTVNDWFNGRRYPSRRYHQQLIRILKPLYEDLTAPTETPTEVDYDWYEQQLRRLADKVQR